MSRFQALAESIAADRRATVVPGDEVFRLYDTYGFPADLTGDLAEEQGLTVDTVGFDAAMEAQREASRGGGASRTRRAIGPSCTSRAAGQKTEFVGYDDTHGGGDGRSR